MSIIQERGYQYTRAGETKWYVDDEGIISLKVGDKIYGEGKIVNSVKINAKVIASDEYIKNKAKARIEVAYEDELQNVIFNNETITEFEKQENAYIIEREVTKNGIYEIVANGENGATSKTSIEVNQIEVLNSNIQIKSTVTPSSDYVKATMGIEITYSGEIESIKINGESQAVPSKAGEKYVISKEVLENGEYKIEVKGKDGTINKVIVKVSDITEDMEIWNRADMESFRDKVNSGRTYEGKTVTVMADIDLGGSNNNWIPIGGDYSIKEKNVFNGTFEGNKHIIENLYINSNAYKNVGLFASSSGTIQDIILKNVNINNTKDLSSSNTYTGGIAGISNGNITNCGIESGTISSKSTIAASKFSYMYLGGIVGVTGNDKVNEVKGCYNKAILTANVPKVMYNVAFVGGIVGVNYNPVSNCYNTGTLSATGGHAIVGGVTAETEGSVSNSYSIGGISGSGTIEQLMGSIIGKVYTIYPTNTYGLDTSYGYSYRYLSNNNWMYATSGRVSSTILKSYASQLGSAFKSDKNPNINNGYPILDWQ